MSKNIVVTLFVMLLGLQAYAHEGAPKILSINDETVIDNGYATLYDYSFTVYRNCTLLLRYIDKDGKPLQTRKMLMR